MTKPMPNSISQHFYKCIFLTNATPLEKGDSQSLVLQSCSFVKCKSAMTLEPLIGQCTHCHFVCHNQKCGGSYSI